MLSVKQGGIKFHFKVFGMTRPGPLANTLTAGPMSRLIWQYKDIGMFEAMENI